MKTIGKYKVMTSEEFASNRDNAFELGMEAGKEAATAPMIRTMSMVLNSMDDARKELVDMWTAIVKESQ